MAIPAYHMLMLPLLKILEDGQEHALDDVSRRLAQRSGVSGEELKELLPSGKQAIFDNRVGWARTYLKKARLLESPARGKMRITARGLDVLKTAPTRIDEKLLRQFPEFVEFKTQRKPRVIASTNDQGENLEEDHTPEETLEAAYQNIRVSLAQDLLERIKNCTPKFFENLVVDLLVAMGYGGSRKDAGRAVGKSGDDGIDGVIDEDRLGLDKVYIQAKRWEATVGRPALQAFAGSLEGHGAMKGVLITTSDFSEEAREYTRRIQKRIVLIDGRLLADLMIESGVGVTTTSKYEIKKLDLDYFEGE